MNYIHNPPNNLLPIFLLDILEKQTDEKKRLSQAQILGILKEDYDMVVDRKTLRRNMEQLIDLGFGIKYDETEKKTPVRKKNKETGEMETLKDPATGEEVIRTVKNWGNYYLVRDFDESEVRLLIDSLLFSGLLPRHQLIGLAEKLAGLVGPSFREEVSYIYSLQDSELINRAMSWNIERLNEAIKEKKWVSFTYLYYGMDKKLHPRDYRPGGSECTVLPLQMLVHEGRYYLLDLKYFPNGVEHSGVMTHQIHFIKDLKMIDKPTKDLARINVPEQLYHIDVNRFLKNNHPSYGKKSIHMMMRTDHFKTEEILRELGEDLTFTEIDGEVIVTGMVNEIKLVRFAQGHSPYVKVIEPKRIVKRLEKWAKQVSRLYGSPDQKEKGQEENYE